ncbi:hypothetical protein [Robertkochia aurantiaca]|uniref:hypothetical protein n=1 Tax=Robertkochia aurantiaca TaxID=2873700 RepID=UPI001CCF7258|nr:hypothetical protein [Robertkochia sp. 3YJGBD-33]
MKSHLSLFSHFIFLPLAVLLFFSCNNDDLNDSPDSRVSPELTLIGYLQGSVVQADLTENGNPFTLTDHSAINGVPASFLRYDLYAERISFYSRIPENFRSWDIFYDAPEGTYYESFCSFNPEDILLYPLSSAEKLIAVTGTPITENLREIAVYLRDKQESECVRLTVGNTAFFEYSAITEGENLYIGYLDETGNTVITKIDLTTLEGVWNINLGVQESFKATLDQDRIYFFLSGNELEVRSTQSGELISRKSLNSVNLDMPQGFFRTAIYNDQILLRSVNPQPNRFPYSPVILDINTLEMNYPSENDLSNRISNDLKGMLPAGKMLVELSLPYTVDLSNDLVIYSCTFSNGSENSSGVVISDLQGTVFDYFDLGLSMTIGEILVR